MQQNKNLYRPTDEGRVNYSGKRPRSRRPRTTTATDLRPRGLVAFALVLTLVIPHAASDPLEPVYESIEPGTAAEVWPVLAFGGGCNGVLSKKSATATVGGTEAENGVIDLALYFIKVEYEELYYKVTCSIEATPMAYGEGGAARTVWLEQNGDKILRCEYLGVYPQDYCQIVGTPGAASANPMAGSFEDGKAPSSVTAEWAFTRIGASGQTLTGLDSIRKGLDPARYTASFGISWTSEDESLGLVVEALNDATEAACGDNASMVVLSGCIS